MTEAMLVNLFLMVRVFLIGGFLLILPRIIRKGLLFGVYVGEEVAVGSAAKKLVRSWRQGCVLVMLLSLFVGYGISLAGRPVTGNLTGTAVLLCSALLLYIVVYSRARKLVSPGAPLQASKAVASLEKRNSKEAGFAKFSLAICLIAALANIAYAAISYRALPGIDFTEAHPLADKSIFIFLFFPYLNLVISLIFALLALLTAGAKHALRDGSDSHSLEAQNAFRALNVKALSWIALLSCAFLTLLSVQFIRARLTEVESLGTAGWWLAGAFFVAFFVCIAAFLIRIIKGYGQGGSFREFGSAQTPLTGSLADNEHWVLGLFYFDRNDPAMMIEKRFGFGYGLNYGNRNAMLIAVVFLALFAGLITLAVIGSLN